MVGLSEGGLVAIGRLAACLPPGLLTVYRIEYDAGHNKGCEGRQRDKFIDSDDDVDCCCENEYTQNPSRANSSSALENAIGEVKNRYEYGTVDHKVHHEFHD